MIAPASLSRRNFLKLSAGGFAVGSVMSLVDARPTQARVQSLKTAGVQEIPSVCPYCAVGCGMLVGVKDGKIVNIEGNPDNPINRGTLCPKGAAADPAGHPLAQRGTAGPAEERRQGLALRTRRAGGRTAANALRAV